jgi:hypothetical protein
MLTLLTSVSKNRAGWSHSLKSPRESVWTSDFRVDFISATGRLLLIRFPIYSCDVFRSILSVSTLSIGAALG